MPSLKESVDAFVSGHEPTATPSIAIIQERARRVRRRRTTAAASVAILGLVTGAAALSSDVLRSSGDSVHTPEVAPAPTPRKSNEPPVRAFRDLSRRVHLRGHDVPPVLPHSGPCVGSLLDLPADQADLRVAAPVLVPKAPQASFANLDSLWRCDDGSFVATFGSGVEVVAQPGWEKVSDPSAWWRGYLATNGYGKASTVHGAPGVVEEPDGDHRGLAQAIVQGWMVIVLGNTKLSGDQLNSIAATL